jgi:hypothetical protein
MSNKDKSAYVQLRDEEYKYAIYGILKKLADVGNLDAEVIRNMIPLMTIADELVSSDPSLQKLLLQKGLQLPDEDAIEFVVGYPGALVQVVQSERVPLLIRALSLTYQFDLRDPIIMAAFKGDYKSMDLLIWKLVKVFQEKGSPEIYNQEIYNVLEDALVTAIISKNSNKQTLDVLYAYGSRFDRMKPMLAAVFAGNGAILYSEEVETLLKQQPTLIVAALCMATVVQRASDCFPVQIMEGVFVSEFPNATVTNMLDAYHYRFGMNDKRFSIVEGDFMCKFHACFPHNHSGDVYYMYKWFVDSLSNILKCRF